MQDLGYLLFGIIDGLVLVGVFAGFTWAAMRDGADERAFRAQTAAPGPQLALAGG